MSRIRRFLTTLKMGLKGAWTHRSMGFASIISIFATLFILGLVLIITVTANSVVLDIHNKVDEVELFITSGSSSDEIDQLKEDLENSGYVESIEYKSSEDALELMKKSWGENADILEGVDVLPASYVVKLYDIDDTEKFVEEFTNVKTVDDITYYKDIVGKVSKITKFVQTAGVALTILLLLISVFIISNTIKLTVYARSKEISVMKYIGATNHMIRGPFIIEGLVFGLIGALLSYFAIIKLYEYIYINYSGELYNIISSYMINPELIDQELLKIFLALGVGIGVVGSTFSMRKHLKV